jgi:ribonuclease HI
MRINIYTDGSCHPQMRVGAWAAIILAGEDKVVLTGKSEDTTHNRMELTAVIKAIEYIAVNYAGAAIICIYSDSQYVVRLQDREKKLTDKDFTTKKGKDIQNSDLVKQLYTLAGNHTIEYIHIRAHQKKNDTINYNIEADQYAGATLKEAIKEAGETSELKFKTDTAEDAEIP